MFSARVKSAQARSYLQQPRELLPLGSGHQGIGFKTADRTAQDIGIAFDSPYRAQAAPEYTLAGIADGGHVFSPLDELIDGCIQRVEVPQEPLHRAHSPST
jgi:hypothetical protein